MVFLSSVDIIDTGFLRKSKIGSQLSSGLRANDGDALRLKGVEINISSSSNLDSSPYTGIFSEVSIPLISSNPTTIQMKIILVSENTDTNNPYEINDMGYLSALLDLPKTAGVKGIYYPVSKDDADLNDNNQQIIYYMGAADTTEPQGDISLDYVYDDAGTATVASGDLTNVKYLSVRFESCDLVQTTDRMIEVQLTGYITT